KDRGSASRRHLAPKYEPDRLGRSELSPRSRRCPPVGLIATESDDGTRREERTSRVAQRVARGALRASREQASRDPDPGKSRETRFLSSGNRNFQTYDESGTPTNPPFQGTYLGGPLSSKVDPFPRIALPWSSSIPSALDPATRLARSTRLSWDLVVS